MRIAMFTDSFYPELGGIQDSILANVRELGARGHRVMLFAPAAAPRDYAYRGLPAGEPEVGPNVTIRRLPSIPIPSSSQQSRLVIPTGRALRELKTFHPQLIHMHTFLGAGFEALRAARRLQLPLVGTNHWYAQGFDLYAPVGRAAFRRFCGRALARFYSHCDWVTTPSRFTLDDLRAHGMERRARVISNPIDTHRFRPATTAERQQLKQRLGFGNSVVIYAGRLAREKRIDVILHAVARARQRVPDITLVIAGHGNDRTRLETLARQLGIASRVRFVGTLTHAELADLFAAAEVFAIASTSETQSMVLLQAMACGLPAVGVRSGGLSEHIPMDTGLLAAPGDSADFASQLGRVLNDPERDAMGRIAHDFASRFSVSAITNDWEALYVRASATLNDPRPISLLIPD